MSIVFKNNDIFNIRNLIYTEMIKIIYKYLDKATVYFEYGSGGSTYQASIRDNIKEYISRK